MQFTHIRINNQGVELEYIEVKPAGPAAVKLPPSQNAPLPEFKAALAAFKPFVFSLLGLPEAWNDDVVIKGIAIKKPDDNNLRGLNVTWTRRIEKANGKEMLSNTPFLPQRGEKTSENIATLDDETLELIETAEAEAERYLNGEHAGQQDMFKGDKIAHAEERKAAAKANGNGTHKKAGKGEIRGVGTVHNPEATEPTTDGVLRKLLLDAGRDVPEDAIAKWTSMERDSAQRWAAASIRAHSGDLAQSAVPKEPKCVQRNATPALIEN